MEAISLATYYIFLLPPDNIFLFPKKLWNSVPPLWNKSHKEEEKNAKYIPTEKKKKEGKVL